MHTSKGLVCPYNGDVEEHDAEHEVAYADPYPLVMICTTTTKFHAVFSGTSCVGHAMGVARLWAHQQRAAASMHDKYS